MEKQTNGNNPTATATATLPPPTPNSLDKEPPEVAEAKALAQRYRLPYIDLLPPDKSSPISYEELAGIPVELMLRNQFVPLRREGRNLHVGMADPTNLEVLDELENVLNVRVVPSGIVKTVGVMVSASVCSSV